MDTTLKDTLARIERLAEASLDAQRSTADRLRMLEDAQRSNADQLRMMIERLEQVIQLLQPEERDGPSLDELLGHIVGQLTELIGYARQSIKMLTGMEQNLPGDVARELLKKPVAIAGANGNGKDSRA